MAQALQLTHLWMQARFPLSASRLSAHRSKTAQETRAEEEEAGARGDTSPTLLLMIGIGIDPLG